MMEVKLFEIRDRGTLVPAIGIKLSPRNIAEDWLLDRAGYVFDADAEYVLLARLIADSPIQYDQYEWGDRTMRAAHNYIIEHWDRLSSGAVVDAEYILGETAAPKISERLR